MAMTEAVKDELGRLSISKPCCRKAEVSSILRFAGGLHIAAGKIIIEVELDAAQSARRLRKDIAEIFGHESELSVVSSSGIRKGSRYIVRVLVDGDALARQTGLVDANNRPIRGLPPQVVSAAICDSEAAWRGAFLAHGSLTEPGRSSALEITCPGPEAALALVGAARRLGITAKAREVRGVDRVVVRDGDAIGALLTLMGATDSFLAWEERRMRRERGPTQARGTFRPQRTWIHTRRRRPAGDEYGIVPGSARASSLCTPRFAHVAAETKLSILVGAHQVVARDTHGR